MKDGRALKIIDANLNRSREGLRVCEEVARFLLLDRPLSFRLKKARHRISAEIERLGAAYGDILRARRVGEDPGKAADTLETKRPGVDGICLANMERAKESLRVLEEMTKLTDVALSGRFKKIRFYV